jgi:uncharacterized protein (TIGR02271 family)
MMTRNTVVGVFDDRDDAQRAIEALKDAGFRSDDIGVTMRDRREAEALVEDTGTHAGAGAATGALAGGALGGLAGWLVGIGALAIPGVGPIIAAGPLAAALGGAAIGAAGGGLIGALTGMGVPEDEAKWYEGEVHRGGTLVTVRADGRYGEARRIMREYDAREAGADTPTTGHADAATTGYAGTATMDRGHDRDVDRVQGSDTVQLREEELRANKEMRQTGEVGIRKEVHEEQRTIDVPVTREEVVVERRPVDRRAADRMDVGDVREGETIRVPVREERVTVEKRPVVTEEVSVAKRPVTETERVSDTVRREEAVVDREGDVDVSGDWSRLSGDFRNRWQSRYGTSGRTWEQDEPGYRYGYEMARDPRYKGRQWSEVESDLGRDWGSRYSKYGRWEEMKDRAREAWDYGR